MNEDNIAADAMYIQVYLCFFSGDFVGEAGESQASVSVGQSGFLCKGSGQI